MAEGRAGCPGRRGALGAAVAVRTVVGAWLRVMVAVGRAMLSGGAGEARAGHGGLLLDTAVRASAARAARH